MDKIVYVDFKTKQIQTQEEHARTQFMRIDPVLEQVRQELPAQQFALYKSVIDDWMNRNFEYQMENEDGKLYQDPEDSSDN